MNQRKRLAKPEDIQIKCSGPLPDNVMLERNKEYYKLSYVEFRKKYRHYLFTPATIEFSKNKYEVQMNFCNDTFCGNYGLPQLKFENIKGKPSRYRLTGAKEFSDESRLLCNEISVNPNRMPINNVTNTISNWSIVEEIKRLVTINTVVPIKPEYTFHKDKCNNKNKTPFDNAECFHKRGLTKSKSAKHQCKECKKITNVLPKQDQRFNYGQKRNDILLDLCKLLFSRTPVKRICENLNIGSKTFYNKLEWLYRKCLEFNQRYETKPLSDMTFNKLWINTDMMVYNLNNVRQKGKGGKPSGMHEKKMQTYIVCSTDLSSLYAFRCDVAYDYGIALDQVEEDTKALHCDHSYAFLRKNDRLRHSFCPQPPASLDALSNAEYFSELAKFNNRKDYVEGCHVKPQYTAIAHYLLLSWLLRSNEWYFVSDDDSVLQYCIFKVFAEQFQDGNAMYYTCQYEKELTLQQAGKHAFRSRKELKRWGDTHKLSNKGIWDIAISKLAYDLKSHNFYDEKVINGIRHPVRGNNPIQHPLPDKDEGIRWVNLINYKEDVKNDVLANQVVQVNSRAVNNFFQEVRRRISILERPLVTARGDGRSYIYTNYNPKYAQQALTIFRTFYNFCWCRKFGDEYMTPAQKLGITDKVYEYKDIVYFR